MAFSILVELNKKSTDWKGLNKALTENSNGPLEFFPIPNYPKNGKDYIGISIANRDFTNEDLESIRVSIRKLLLGEHRVVELYSSSEFTVDNVDMLTDKFFNPLKK